MRIIKCSEFLTRNDIKPFLLGAFYSRTIISNDSKYFFAVGAYKPSKYIFDSDFNFDEYKRKYVNHLNKLSGYHNWFLKSEETTNIKLPLGDYIFILENDLGMTITSFFRWLNSYIMNSDWAYDDEFNKSKKDFIRGFVELRGSIDTTRCLITQDYFYNSKKEMSKVRLLFDQFNIPLGVGNINFRNLQNQFVTGENKRNTQFRLNLYWYAHNIGFINKYKALIFEKKYPYISKWDDNEGITYYNVPEYNYNEYNSFIDYLNYFSQNVYGKALSKAQIEVLRSNLGWDKNTPNSEGRNMKIIDTFRDITPDKCAICGTTHTHINVKTGRPHFEIHHMISFKNGKNVDVIDNLVKLCSNCHAMMKKGSGRTQDQINGIKKILIEQENVYEFCSNYLNDDNIDSLTKRIQELLG